MLGQVNGNYELEIAIIDLDNADGIANTNFTGSIHGNMEDENFLDLAEQLGTVYTLGGFIDKVNTQELDNLTNSYVRAFLVNTDEPEEIIAIDNFNTLFLYSGEVKQR